MSAHPPGRWLPVLFLGSLLAGLTAAGESQAQKKKANPAVQAARQEVKLKEAEALRDAYLLLAGANNNYAGHKAQAMKHVREAVRMLDSSVLKKGTDAQKAATVLEDSAVARARVTAKYVQGVKPQALSDAQVRAAADLLAHVRAALAQNRQPKVLGHVDKAIEQLARALRVR